MGKIRKTRQIQSGTIFDHVVFFRTRNVAPPTPTYLRERDVHMTPEPYSPPLRGVPGVANLVTLRYGPRVRQAYVKLGLWKGIVS